MKIFSLVPRSEAGASGRGGREEKAFVGGKVQERAVNLTLRRNGDKWQVVGIKDEELARKIAEKIGQQLIVAGRGGLQKAGEQFGVQNLTEMIKQLDGIFK